jgi:hypothetical protein
MSARLSSRINELAEREHRFIASSLRLPIRLHQHISRKDLLVAASQRADWLTGAFHSPTLSS